jgi:ankyrin repeat protein
MYASFSFRDRDNPLVVKALLGSGADPNIKDREGLTALHWASRNCQPRIAAALIEGGADLSKYGQTALYQASYARCTEVKELLKQRGVRP